MLVELKQLHKVSRYTTNFDNTYYFGWLFTTLVVLGPLRIYALREELVVRLAATPTAG